MDSLGADNIWGDGHASCGLHLKVGHGGDLRIEHLHERDALSLVPSAQQIQCNCCEDGTNGVHHTLQHGQEDSSSTGTFTMKDFRSWAIVFQTFRLVCRERERPESEQREETEGISLLPVKRPSLKAQ
jgi:hypothetical protein